MPRTIFENIVVKKLENVELIPMCEYTSIRFFEILYIEKGKGV